MVEFGKTIADAYAFEGEGLDLGRGVHEGKVVEEAAVRLPLATSNRHGLIAGATGTGKTRTLQLLTEQLSAAGVPVVAADIKGDVSGIAQPGEAGGPAEKRAKELGQHWTPTGFPTEYFSIGGIGPGVPVRASVSDFGPLLLAKTLGANETQEQSLALVFRYADEKGLPIVDLSDLRALLTFFDSEAGKTELKGIGGVSSATIGVLLRSLVQLEDGGGTEFFGEPQLEIADLIRTAPDGRGLISCLELAAVQDKPKLFSTVLMWLLAELFEQLPEVGDLPKPKLVFFFDEAHLLFADASDAFLESIVQTVRLIRSKGVGVYFITQTPEDIPADVLAQLGNRIQHALRAFTPQDAKALKATVSTFPTTSRPRGASDPARHGRGRGHDPFGERRTDSGRPHQAARAAREHEAGSRCRCCRQGVAALRGVRDADRPGKRPGAARRAGRGDSGARACRRRTRAQAAAAAERRERRPADGLLGSRQGRTIQREVIRGVFGLLRKRL